MDIAVCLIAALFAAGAASDASVQWVDDRTIEWEGRRWVSIDDEAVFYREPFDDGVPSMPASGPSLEKIIARRGFTPPVRCRLVDAIDCTQTTHGFQDDGGSRILTLGGERYRVTAVPSGFELKWFSYVIETAGVPGRPHLLVAQLVNDRERYTTLTVTVPRGETFAPPYAGQEKRIKNWHAFCEQDDGFHPDVGACVYTGGEWPADGRPFLFHYVFYPKSVRMKLTVSASGTIRSPTPDVGGAVAKIWVFEILDPLDSRLPTITPPPDGRQRRVGLYVTHPWYLLAQYGVPAVTIEQRREALEKMMDLLAFCGMNWIEFNAINGADRAAAAWFDSSYYHRLGADLLRELPPVAAKHGTKLVPVVTSLTAPSHDLDDVRPNRYGFTTESFIQPAVAGERVHAFHNHVPDPMRPEVQAWLIRHIREIAERCKSAPCYEGIGFRVNGRIGLCYIAWEKPLQDRTYAFHSAAESGYSRWNLEEFRRDTGVAVPLDPSAAYRALRANPSDWDRWLDFRCRRTRDLWLKVRDVVRSYRPDWKLYVLTDLPAEVPATNVEWPGPEAPDREKITLDLLRAHGYDPRMYSDTDGIVVQRVMMIDSDRYWAKWGSVHGTNTERHKTFHFQPFLPAWYRTAAGSAVELYHNYWEEPFHPDGEFGCDDKGFGLRTATATAKGRAFYEAATFSIRYGNVDTIALTGWQRPVLGHEHDLRRFCQAFRALPAGEPRPFDGTVEIVTCEARDEANAAKDDPGTAEDTLWVRWLGDRLAIVNDAPVPRTARIRLRTPFPSGERLRDAATGAVFSPSASSDRPEFVIDLEMYDLRTLVPVRSD